MIPALRARAALFELFDYLFAFAVRVACGAGAAMMAVLVVARRRRVSRVSPSRLL